LRLHRILRGRVPHNHLQLLVLRSTPVALHLRMKHPRRHAHLELGRRLFFFFFLRTCTKSNRTANKQQQRHPHRHANSLSSYPSLANLNEPRNASARYTFSRRTSAPYSLRSCTAAFQRPAALPTRGQTCPGSPTLRPHIH